MNFSKIRLNLLGVGLLAGALVAGGAFAKGQGKGKGKNEKKEGEVVQHDEGKGKPKRPHDPARAAKRAKLKLARAMNRRPLFVEQAGQRTRVYPLTAKDENGKALSVEEFYSYDNPIRVSANTPEGVEVENLSQLFFYSAGPDDLSLVIIHSSGDPNRKPSATSQGGKATFEFSNLPTGYTLAVQDDPGGSLLDKVTQVDTTGLKYEWGWICTYTDGVAIAGFDGRFSVEIKPDFIRGVTAWKVRSAQRSGPDQLIDLDMTKPIKLIGVGKPNKDRHPKNRRSESKR
jgi:hypothetical protein